MYDNERTKRAFNYENKEALFLALVRRSSDRFVEIWNLVFMQYEITNVRSKYDFDIVGELPATMTVSEEPLVFC